MLIAGSTERYLEMHLAADLASYSYVILVLKPLHFPLFELQHSVRPARCSVFNLPALSASDTDCRLGKGLDRPVGVRCSGRSLAIVESVVFD